MSYYYLNTPTNPDTLVCDYIDLAGDALDRATAYIVSLDPSFAETGLPLDLHDYAVYHNIMFDVDGNAYTYRDNADWSYAYFLPLEDPTGIYDHPDCPGLISFTDLPDGQAIAAAMRWLAQEQLIADSSPAMLDDARLAANAAHIVFTYDGKHGIPYESCRIVDSIDL